MGVARDDRREQLAVAATHIDDALAASEVIGLGSLNVGATAEGDHGALEQSALLRMAGQPLETRRAEHMLEGRIAGAHGMEELPPGAIGLPVDHADEVARAIRRIGPEAGAEFGLREAARDLLAEHAFAREKAE